MKLKVKLIDITNGFLQEEFKFKMDELKKRKIELEVKLSEIESNDIYIE